jgi:TolB protein
VINADGTDERELTNNPSDDYFPAWSLNGTKIAFCSKRDGNPEIYVMNPDGSNQIRVTNNPANDIYPQWVASTYVK